MTIETITKHLLLFLVCICRLQASNQLETSLQNGKALLSNYENKLARETAAPSDPASMENTLQDLAVGVPYEGSTLCAYTQ